MPLLLAVPALETLVGWHTFQIESGLDAAESGRDYRRHVRSVAVATVAALLPPLAAGIALAAAAYRLPYGATTRDGVLALAAGTLLGGAVRGHLRCSPPGVTPASPRPWPPLRRWPSCLPAAPLRRWRPADDVAVLAGDHLVGLLVVALTAADHRRTS